MNYENEKKMARQVLGANHGESLVGKAPATAAAMTTGHMNASVKNNAKPDPISGSGLTDSERMMQYLDNLTVRARDLTTHAHYRLNQFLEPRPAVCNDVDKQACDNRECSSEYFRMLESRIEMLNESLGFLEGILGSVSAPLQTGP
jgi:hypothetical protein